MVRRGWTLNRWDTVAILFVMTWYNYNTLANAKYVLGSVSVATKHLASEMWNESPVQIRSD